MARSPLATAMDSDFTIDLLRVTILLIGAYAFAASLYGAVPKLTARKEVERTSEPPTISSSIPYFGHVLQVMRNGFQEYFGQLSYESLF